METVKILSWTIAAVVVTILIARQVTKAIVFRKIGLDDSFILIAALLAIGLSAITIILAANGRASSLSLTFEQGDIVSKGYYVSELFYISAVCFPKLSILVLFYTIVTGQRFVRYMVLILGLFIFTWTSASLVAIAVQCELPYPWRAAGSHCLNSRIFWVIYCVFDVLTEIALIILPVYMIALLQLQLSRKIAVVSCFAPRLLVIGAALVRLIWLYPIIPQQPHQYRIWDPLIASQVQVLLSIATASIPFMVPYCRGLGGRLQRSTSTKPSMHLSGEKVGHRILPIWFRRHCKSRDAGMRNPGPDDFGRYELVPRRSPNVPFARSMTRLSTAKLQTSPEKQRSVKGLNIYIPRGSSLGKPSQELISPRTQSSGMLSPWSTSPQALLQHSFVPSRKAPTPPLKTPCLSPSTSGFSHTSRRDILALGTPRNQRSLVSRSLQSTTAYTQPQEITSPVLTDPRSRNMKFTADYAIEESPTGLSPRTPQLRGRLSAEPPQCIQPPKFSLKARLQTSPLSTLNENNVRPGSDQDLTSPMGAAINGWFSGPHSERLPQFSPLSPSSARDSSDQYTFTPVESLRMPAYPLFSHTRSPAKSNVFLDEPSPSHSLYYASRASDTGYMPPIRDLRNSPRVIIRDV